MHEAVCLDACVNGLITKVDGLYIDATFGRGGHSSAILTNLGATGRLFAFDRDPEAAKVAFSMENKDVRLRFFAKNFSDIPQELEREKLLGCVDGILLDLGVSSPQLDTADRGFSFRLPGPIDMRMDPSQGRPASDWLAECSESELINVIRKLGEERFAKRIASAIITNRNKFTTTTELAEIISKAVPVHEPGKHPATRTFQAIRMHINQELEQLELVLAGAMRSLAVGGRLVVLSYHSLEHKAVKKLYQKYGPGNQDPNELQTKGSKIVALKRIEKARKASPVEIAHNRRARSAFLRIFEKVADI